MDFGSYKIYFRNFVQSWSFVELRQKCWVVDAKSFIGRSVLIYDEADDAELAVDAVVDTYDKLQIKSVAIISRLAETVSDSFHIKISHFVYKYAYFSVHVYACGVPLSCSFLKYTVRKKNGEKAQEKRNMCM